MTPSESLSYKLHAFRQAGAFSQRDPDIFPHSADTGFTSSAAKAAKKRQELPKNKKSWERYVLHKSCCCSNKTLLYQVMEPNGEPAAELSR